MANSVLMANITPGMKIKRNFTLTVDYYHDNPQPALIRVMCDVAPPVSKFVNAGAGQKSFLIQHFDDDREPHELTATLSYQGVMQSSDTTYVIVNEASGVPFNLLSGPNAALAGSDLITKPYKFPNPMKGTYSGNSMSNLIKITLFRMEDDTEHFIGDSYPTVPDGAGWTMKYPFPTNGLFIGSTMKILVEEKTTGGSPVRSEILRTIYT